MMNTKNNLNKTLMIKAIDSVVFMTLSMGFSLCISAVGRFALAAQLDARIFGNFTMAMVFIGFTMLFVNTMGDRFIVVTKHDREKAVNTVLTTELFVWFVLAVGWLCLSPVFWEKLGGGMSWGLASLLLLQGLATPLSRPRALLERDLNFKIISIVNVLTQFLCVGIAILLAMKIKNELPLIISSLAMLLQSIVFIKVGGIRIRLCMDYKIFREYIRLCLPLMASGLLVYSYWNGDKLLLDQYVTREEIGYYGWAFSLGAMILRIKSVVSSVIFPVFAELVRSDQRDQIQKGLSQIYRALMLFNGFIAPALVVTAPYFVRLAGERWMGAVLCVQIAILIFSVRTLNSFLEPIFVTHAKSHLLMYVAMFNACFILVGGWVALSWMPRIEIMAAVILMSCVITFFICMKAIKQVCGVNLFLVIAPGLAFSLLSWVVMCTTISLFGEHLFVVFLAVSLGVLLFCAGMWRDGFQLVKILRKQITANNAT